MWWVKTDSSGEDRGGFQNRDVGRVSFAKDFGPDYGVDYARYSDPPDYIRDLALKNKLEKKIGPHYDLIVRNGFVVIKGFVPNEETRKSVLETLHAEDGVVEVISDLHFYGG